MRLISCGLCWFCGSIGLVVAADFQTAFICESCANRAIDRFCEDGEPEDKEPEEGQ